MADPLIISCALTGTLATIEDNPNLPYDPEAIGRAAVEAWREGAAIVHIHARADDGVPTWEPEYFRRAIDVVRSADCDVVINLTTSYGGTGEDNWDRRFAALDPRPELASFDCGSMNFGPMVFRNSPDFLAELAGRMLAAHVKPELEIFDTGQIGNALRLADESLLAPPLFFQFVLGVAGGAAATPRNLVHLVESIPDAAPWSVCAIGRAQLPMNAHAIAMGGHARTGLEDNLWYRRGVPASNAMLVERVRQLSELMDRPVATPDQAREILGLGARDRSRQPQVG
jgi:3-keto-5-aminohexanoate cleavage enzyme